jgi:ribose 1,5-bisphosphokinase
LLVVIDGSREHFIANMDPLANAIPVLITADASTLRHRLRTRAREDAPTIELRLHRAAAFSPAHPMLLTIDNSGPIEVAGEAMTSLLRRAAASAA